VLTSTLEFECLVCGLNSYSLGHSISNGSAGADQVPCLSCPDGGSCVDGSVVATPGYWGAVNSQGEAQFLLCPASYCCDGGLSPCLAMQSCAGGRSGPLCGDCGPGLVEAVDSTACVDVDRCPEDQATVFSVLVVGVLLLGLAQLAIVSQVWQREVVVPSARLKLLIYFAQVRGFFFFFFGGGRGGVMQRQVAWQPRVPHEEGEGVARDSPSAPLMLAARRSLPT
jgi:hypothetical protein